MKTKWIYDFIKDEEYYAPYTIDKDNEYEFAVCKKVQDYCSKIKQADLDSIKYVTIKDFADNVLHTIHLWYEGNIVIAQAMVDDCIQEIRDGSTSVCDANKCPAFWGYKPPKEEKNPKVQFFRGRTVDTYEAFQARDMFHIGFSERSKATSARFSILGLPCLYLGNTSYDCWVEMGKPSDNEIAVSPVLIEAGVRIFNLAVAHEDIEEFTDDIFEDENDREESLWSMQNL